MADKPYVSPRRLKRFFTGLLGEKLNTKEEILANTDEGKFAGAAAVKEMFEEVGSNLGGFTPIIDETTGQITGYKTKVGADTVFPFSSKNYTVLENLVVKMLDNGSGATVDLTSFENYTNITVDNIHVETIKGNTWTPNSTTYTGTLSKSYNPATGILTLSTGTSNVRWWTTPSVTTTYSYVNVIILY